MKNGHIVLMAVIGAAIYLVFAGAVIWDFETRTEQTVQTLCEQSIKGDKDIAEAYGPITELAPSAEDSSEIEKTEQHRYYRAETASHSLVIRVNLEGQNACWRLSSCQTVEAIPRQTEG